jgi:hypothetical protein
LRPPHSHAYTDSSGATKSGRSRPRQPPWRLAVILRVFGSLDLGQDAHRAIEPLADGRAHIDLHLDIDRRAHQKSFN